MKNNTFWCGGLVSYRAELLVDETEAPTGDTGPKMKKSAGVRDTCVAITKSRFDSNFPLYPSFAFFCVCRRIGVTLTLM